MNDQSLLDSEESEQALLAAILLKNEALADIEFLRAEHFLYPVHGRILEAARAQWRRGSVADPVTLFATFESDPDLRELGGAKYLAHLMGALVSVRNAGDYARAIVDLAQRRQMITLGQSLIARAGGSDPMPDLLADLRQRVEAIEEQRVIMDDDTVSLRDRAIHLALQADTSARPRLIPTGLAALDEALGGGLWPGDLTMVAGRTSMGKTAFAETLGIEMASRDAMVLMHSMETSLDQLSAKALQRNSGISVAQQMRGGLSAADVERLRSAAEAVPQNVMVSETVDQRPSDIKARARAFLRQHGRLDLITVDQLSMMESDRRAWNNRERLNDIIRDLASVARSLKVPLVLLHQLNRETDKREDKRPTMADLSETGASEQRARAVLLLYRPEYYLLRARPLDQNNTFAIADWSSQLAQVRGKAEVIIAKQHLGEAPKHVSLLFDAARQWFASPTGEQRAQSVMAV